MHITLYKNLSEPNKLDKTLTSLHTVTGNLRNNCSIIKPVIVFDAVDWGEADLTQINYAYIQEFGRYYFVDDIRLATKTLWELSMSIDVLYTYKTQIRAIRAVVSRTEDINKANLYLPDNRLIFEDGTNVSTKKFPNDIPESTKIILTVAGGNTETAPSD